ncbi:MAG: hypothetical protein L0228_09310 [Planctomycetes bacterium]|nr:hypothetical protein [Planctomycetota bacterium]
MPRPTYAIILAATTGLAAFAGSAPIASAQAPCHHCRCAPTYKSRVPGCCLCDAGCCGCDLGYMKPIQRAEWYNWNRNYANTEYGQPVALVVPPTANMQTNWGWGVASSRISRIDHQFQRNYPGDGQFGGPFRTTPLWPSDTTQFGVYHVRGPW